MKLVVLAGGGGAAKFLSGLVKSNNPEKTTVVVNTGDDLEHFGLYISPDVDIIIYALTDQLNRKQWWGIDGDTYDCLVQLKKMGYDTWFNLGDQDLAMHIHRTFLLKQGSTLTEITAKVCRRFGLKSKIIPMSDNRVETRVCLETGKDVSFEEYLVKLCSKPRIKDLYYAGIESAAPAPGVLKAIYNAAGIILAPSNPLASIGPILALPEVWTALKTVNVPKVAISPLIAGKTIKGPADRMMADLGHDVSALGVARLYADILDYFILDEKDRALEKSINNLGLKTIRTNTIMNNEEAAVKLADRVIKVFAEAKNK